MATREQILGMFGATPAQVRQRQLNQEQTERDSSSSGMDKAGKAIGQGLGTLFGLKSPEMEMAEQMQGAMQGVDLQDPTQLRALAQTVSSFNPQSALLLAEKAREIEKQTTGERVSFPVKVGTKPIMKVDIQGNSVKVGEEDIWKEVPHTKVDGKWTPMLDYGQSNAEGTPKEETPKSNPSMIYDPDSGNLKTNPDYDPTKPATTSMFGPGPGISSPTPSVNGPSVMEPQQNEVVAGMDPSIANRDMTTIANMDPRQSIAPPPNLQGIGDTVRVDTASDDPSRQEVSVTAPAIQKVSDDILIRRYQALKKKGAGRKPSDNMLYKKIESQLLARGLDGALK